MKSILLLLLFIIKFVLVLGFRFRFKFEVGFGLKLKVEIIQIWEIGICYHKLIPGRIYYSWIPVILNV